MSVSKHTRFTLYFPSHLEAKLLVDNNRAASTDSIASSLSGNSFGSRIRVMVGNILIFPAQTGLRFLLQTTCLESEGTHG